MDPLIRRLALLAAQKTASPSFRVPPSRGAEARRAALRSSLVLGLTGGLLGGCALSHAGPREPVSDSGAPDVAPDVAVPADSGADVPVECESLLASLEITAPPDAWGAQFTDEAVRLDPAVGACCHQWDIGVRDGSIPGEGWPPSPLAFACCDVVVFAQNLESSSILGCTPWGPPCPPEMCPPEMPAVQRDA